MLLNGHALRQEENDNLTATRFMCDERALVHHASSASIQKTLIKNTSQKTHLQHFPWTRPDCSRLRTLPQEIMEHGGEEIRLAQRRPSFSQLLSVSEWRVLLGHLPHGCAKGPDIDLERIVGRPTNFWCLPKRNTNDIIPH